MKVIELVQCILWGVFGVAPIMSGMFFVDSEDNRNPWVLIGFVLQVAFGVACYKAGGGFK